MNYNNFKLKEVAQLVGQDILKCFRGRNLLWQIAAILLTYLLVISGVDWKYYQYFQNSSLTTLFFSAALVGFLVPVFLPIIIYTAGSIKSNGFLLRLSFAIVEVEILSWLISFFYKMFTGRAHPEFGGLTDISQVFHFGISRGGIFWGWPSSHTAVAFALAALLATVYCSRYFWRTSFYLYAFYIGLSVAATIHWFSDFVAGAIIGTIIGQVVGKRFLRSFKD